MISAVASSGLMFASRVYSLKPEPPRVEARGRSGVFAFVGAYVNSL
jgi:hypothetical protein